MNRATKYPPAKALLVFIAVLILSIYSIRNSNRSIDIYQAASSNYQNNGSIEPNGTTSEEELAKLLGTGEKKETANDVHANVPSRRFSDSTRLNVDRGLNIINCWSGHQMATWTYNGRKRTKKKYWTWKGEPKVRRNDYQFELELDHRFVCFPLIGTSVGISYCSLLVTSLHITSDCFLYFRKNYFMIQAMRPE